MSDWTLAELERWDERIREKVEAFGLDCYPQEFEICDQNAMLGYMAYHGMPAHYPHWSYGKAYEQTKTMYDHGVTGLPYELVINSDPCLAYLMRDNSLLLQILTIAHVYGHNDFFKNNFTFTSATRASETIAAFKTRADRVRRYIEDPSIGADAVEQFLDAAHALAFCCNRNAAMRKLSPAEQKERAIERARPRPDPFAALHRRVEPPAPDLSRVPLEPDRDLLLFIRDHNRELADWQKDLLTIVDEEARYFLPQIETKIMNEGWASFWHHRILSALDLPPDLHLEFLVRHNQVVSPHRGGLNPYHIGFVVWRDIERRFGGEGSPEAREKLAAVRESERDQSFLRRFLTPELMHELDLFTYKPRGEHLVVSEVSDEEGWETVKAALLARVGSAAIPVVAVVDADYRGTRTLYLRHEHDGRDLDIASAEKTLAHVRTLWGHKVHLETRLKGRPALLTSGPDGFDAKLLV
ncbi:MAG: SpoVR family protein [Geminicoccaceae bacterium]|nr:SpoVR family protein [Geminicoccaceae bacterium]MCX8100164.1 SpoVR family protein [Geminicoccaceae bacterium]